jgi:hypothetical protein
MLFRVLKLLLAASLAAGASGGAAASVAGVFQFVAGEVNVQVAAGAQRPARKGTPLSAGDTVVSGDAGTAQIKMGDGAIVVVQPRSRLTVVAFHYEGREDGTERVHYRLERGGFRAVTGVIGRRNRDNYLIETPIAQMGVRGTDHESYFLTAQDADGRQGGRPGAYNKVNVGLTFLRNQSGEVVIGPNQVGYAASATDNPQLLAAIPAFFNRGVGPRSGAQPRGEPQQASGQSDPAAPTVIQNVYAADGTSLITDLNETSGGASSGSGGGAGGGSVSSSVVGYTAATGNNSGLTGVGLAVAPNGAALGNAGGDPAFAVDWGSWLGGVATVGGVATQGATHFVNAAQATTAAQLAALPPTVVTATYNYAGGPAPTNHLGVAGTINSLSVGANFATQQITSYNLNATVGGASWTANGSGSFAQFSGAGIALNGACAGCNPAPPASIPANGTANGVFVGGAAERMISSFGLKAANHGLSGAAYLAR